jgi:hypothetical protein
VRRNNRTLSRSSAASRSSRPGPTKTCGGRIKQQGQRLLPVVAYGHTRSSSRRTTGMGRQQQREREWSWNCSTARARKARETGVLGIDIRLLASCAWLRHPNLGRTRHDQGAFLWTRLARSEKVEEEVGWRRGPRRRHNRKGFFLASYGVYATKHEDVPSSGDSFAPASHDPRGLDERHAATNPAKGRRRIERVAAPSHVHDHCQMRNAGSLANARRSEEFERKSSQIPNATVGGKRPEL